MESKDWFLLTTLAAIWGSAFMFIKISAVDFGPILIGDLKTINCWISFYAFIIKKKI